jgi:hypothetical protein
LSDGTCGFGVENDRNRPEGAVGQSEFLADALPISFGHKAVQRRETADAHHDQVTANAGADFDLLQASGFFYLGVAGGAFKQAANQTFSTMGSN